MMAHRSVAWIAGACLTVLVVSKRAEAQCWIDSSTCTSSYCNIYCPTTADYIVFGKICFFGYCWWGVCQFGIDGSYRKGSFVGTATTTTVSADYRVFADGGSASGGNDLVRLANPSGEACGSSWVYGVLPNGNALYMFWGDGGRDRIHVGYAPGDPPSQACGSQVAPVNSGRADGRAGDDWIVGTSHGESLWGHDGSDTIWGCSGADTVRGGNNDDYLFGDKGPDVLYGDNGADSLWGEYGTEVDSAYDILVGGYGDDILVDDYGSGEYYGEYGCDAINATTVPFGVTTICDCGADLTHSGRAWDCTTILNCTQDCDPASDASAVGMGTGSDDAADGWSGVEAPADDDAGSCSSDPDAGVCEEGGR